MSLHIGVLDSDRKWLKRIEKSILLQAEKSGLEDREVVVELFSSVKSLKDWNGDMLDALFLEIDLDEDENGIQVAQWVNYNWQNCRIIFLTDGYFHIMESYLVYRSFFLLKSHFDKYLLFALRNIRNGVQRDALKLVFKTIGKSYTYEVAYISEILYLERMGRKTRVVCKNREFFTWDNLNEIERRTETGIFLKCHNSYRVNMMEIQSISKDEVIVNGGDRIKISRTYRKTAVETFEENMRNKGLLH